MAKNGFDKLMSVGIDIGKDVFHLVGFDYDGQLVLRKKIKRMALITTFEELPHCIVGMEACLSAHFVSRTLRKMGFEPRIIPAIYVKRFNKGQKNDYNDAEAIAEAALRPNLKTVTEKTQEQLDLQALHRVRSRPFLAQTPDRLVRPTRQILSCIRPLAERWEINWPNRVGKTDTFELPVVMQPVAPRIDNRSRNAQSP
jgi:hypothetical protein